MNEEDGVGATGWERLLSGLPRAESAPSDVEERIVSVLRARGLIRSARGRTRARLAAVAAGLVLLLAGFGLGRLPAPVAGEPAPGPRFALFLLRGEERLPERPDEEAGRVAEYRAWARSLAEGGRFVRGEKLEDRAATLGGAAGGAPPVPEEEIRGFFIVGASSFDEALAIARQCPHLRHGGRILVRPIATT